MGRHMLRRNNTGKSARNACRHYAINQMASWFR